MMRKKQLGADMTRRRFEEKWLSEGSTIGDYESSMLRSDIRKFYILVAAIMVDEAAIGGQISACDPKDRARIEAFKQYRLLLLGVLDDIQAFSYLAIWKMHADGREGDVEALGRFIRDEKEHLVWAAECLCDYTLASGRPVAEVLAEYSFSEFLAEPECEGMRERLEAIGPLPELADPGIDYLAACQNAEKRPRRFRTKAQASKRREARAEFLALLLLFGVGMGLIALTGFLRWLGLDAAADVIMDIENAMF